MYIHIYVYIYMHMYMHTCSSMCACFGYIHIYVHIYVYMHTAMYTHMHTHINVHVFSMVWKACSYIHERTCAVILCPDVDARESKGRPPHPRSSSIKQQLAYPHFEERRVAADDKIPAAVRIHHATVIPKALVFKESPYAKAAANHSKFRTAVGSEACECSIQMPGIQQTTW